MQREKRWFPLKLRKLKLRILQKKLRRNVFFKKFKKEIFTNLQKNVLHLHDH